MDLTQLNTFITTELLKVHIQSYTGEFPLDSEYKLNNNRNSLELILRKMEY